MYIFLVNPIQNASIKSLIYKGLQAIIKKGILISSYNLELEKYLEFNSNYHFYNIVNNKVIQDPLRIDASKKEVLLSFYKEKIMISVCATTISYQGGHFTSV